MERRKSSWKANFAIFVALALFIIYIEDVYGETIHMSKAEREELKEESRDMFYHAYRAYMENAYPADELMPLSCTGRYKGVTASRGDMDDMLGNFSLTLVDTVDTLVLLGDFEEFEHAVKLIIKDVSFDNDIIVSVFETNIRMLGGLLSAHILAEYLQQRDKIMPWYRGELLDMAKDLGYRLLPAFNTTTGIPHSRVNLKYGMKVPKLQNERETCTACAGTMVLEMAALSRLSGEPIFELKAHKAMDELWKLRHRSSDLMGTVLNVHSGDWVRRDSGVGAGIDSYYEYCLKAYILLGDDKYLNRFNKHYSAVMKYISQGPMLLDVHMHRPHTNSRNFMDAMLAFWPGLQVLSGDLRPAVETHEMLYQIMQRHTFLPEAFTMDFQVVWGQYPLRPEFLESTYFLYKATQDPYYLQVGKKVLRSLQKHARVPCGYASVNDVRTGKHEDRMDSFVLSETFKYLFLLFSDPADLVLDLDEFIFTTEAHFLPLTLGGHVVNGTVASVGDFDESEQEFSRTCPTTLKLFPESVRRPLKDLVSGVCIKRDSPTLQGFRAKDFQPSNAEHLRIVRDMGISLLTLEDGRIQLLHSFSTARSSADAEEGLIFMQEMVELSKSQAQAPETMPQAVMFTLLDSKGEPHRKLLRAGPSHFGPELRGSQKITARVGVANPFRVCSDLTNPEQIKGRIVIMERGDCMFVDKARRVQEAGAVAAIVIDNSPGTSSSNSPMFAMSGDGTDDVRIPVVFLFTEDAINLRTAIATNPGIEITLGDMKNVQNLPASSQNISKKTKILDLQEAIKKIIALSESVNELDKNVITLNDFSAKIMDTEGEKFVEVSYKGPHKSQTKFEGFSRDNLEVEVWWRRLAQNIIRFSSKNRTIITESILQKYFSIVNNISKEVLQTKITLRDIIGWLLNELENERDPDSSSAIPRQLYIEAMSNNGREQLKARVLGEMFKQLDTLYYVKQTGPSTNKNIPNEETVKGFSDDQIASSGADYVERQSDDVIRGDRVYKANKDEL